MNAATLIIASVLALTYELWSVEPGRGAPPRRRALERRIRIFTGKLDWAGTCEFERAMRAALTA